MPISLTYSQDENAALSSTKPVYLIQWSHSGVEEKLSCSGDVVFNGEAYISASVNLTSIDNGRSATLQLPATSERVAEIVSGAWRNQECLIYMIPATPSDEPTYVTADAILVLDGVIVSSRFSGGMVDVSAIHRNSNTSITPRNTLSEICTHIPPPGTVITWGDKITLGSRR